MNGLLFLNIGLKRFYRDYDEDMSQLKRQLDSL